MAAIDQAVVQQQRHIYTHQQLTEYFDRIALPEVARVYDVSTLTEEAKLAFLTLLQKHELCKVPWENLVQHYSIHRTVSTRPNFLFRKIVHDAGRGGYCMEANYFFHLILVALKFDTYIAGSRIYHPDTRTYGGWTHCVNLVTINGNKYLLDGGYGPQGPDRPLPVHDGVTATQIAPAEMKVTYETVSQHLDRKQKVWVYSYRYNEKASWTPTYCFTELEFFPEDIESMNFSPWLNKQTFFTHKVVCVRFTTDKENDDAPGSPDEAAMSGEINGAMTINQDVFKWRRNGKKVVELHMKTESERVGVLKRYFGIELSEEDQESIINTASMIGVLALGTTELT